MRKIRDVDWIEKQQDMALQLFKFLWAAKGLEDVATKLVGLAVLADKKESEEDKSDEDLVSLEWLYLD